MSKELIIRNETFEYPDNGADADEKYAEQMSAWAEAVTDTLSNLAGPDDITLTSFSLADNKATPTVIPLLKFNSTAVLRLEVEFIVTRVIGTTTLVESGLITGNFNGTDFRIVQDLEGDDTGVELSVDNVGQFYYTSSDASHTSCQIKFKASTISND